MHSNASPVTMAQHALQQPPGSRQQPIFMGGNRNERDKMKSGEFYKPYDKQLQQDRQNCKSKLTFFNNSPASTREEGARLLRNVFEAEEANNQLPPNTASINRVGKNTFIESPFRCDYGYNIIIGADVAIESGCFISDPCEVRIEANCMIGPDVHIMGKQFPYNPYERSGTLHGKARGYKITIGEGVCIGAGCKIAPSEEFCKNGVLTIGKGAYVPAGTTVIKVSHRSFFFILFREFLAPIHKSGRTRCVS
jgi:acetyltransferase-like isoleucine patch superfamily enzyme